MNINILKLESVDSTNTEAIKQARAGASEGLCVIARQQTAGRGRQGRSWVSDPDSGLYFSMVLRPRIEGRLLPLITLMAGIAVHDTLAGFGLKPDIKWVNDLLVEDKKICGILAEAVETPAGLAVIVGIGINLRSDNFPSELAATATSIEAVTGLRLTADDLARPLTDQLSEHYSVLQQGHTETIIDRWRQRSTFFSGKAIKVDIAGTSIEGVTDGLEANGALRVRMPNGDLRIVQAGDVHQLRQRKIEL